MATWSCSTFHESYSLPQSLPWHHPHTTSSHAASMLTQHSQTALLNGGDHKTPWTLQAIHCRGSGPTPPSPGLPFHPDLRQRSWETAQQGGMVGCSCCKHVPPPNKPPPRTPSATEMFSVPFDSETPVVAWIKKKKKKNPTKALEKNPTRTLIRRQNSPALEASGRSGT